MKRLKPFILGTLFGAALTFVALRYHVIRHEEGVSLVPRSPQPALRSVYSDVREWGSAMWEKHPELAQAVIANEQIDVISDEALNDISLQVQETFRTTSEKLQSLVSEHRAERAAVAEIDATTVSAQEAHSPDGMTIGRSPAGFQPNQPAADQVPIIEESPAVTPPASNVSPEQWRNPFDTQQRRTGTPTVGADEPAISESDAVASQSRDPWLHELAHTDEQPVTSIPASLEAEAAASGDVAQWLPGLFSHLMAHDGQTMQGAAGPSPLDLGSEAAESEALHQSSLPATSIPARSSIPAPEAQREPIIQVRPF